jgi:hypothetical protein
MFSGLKFKDNYNLLFCIAQKSNKKPRPENYLGQI